MPLIIIYKYSLKWIPCKDGNVSI